MKLFLQKMQNFRALGLRPQTPIDLRLLNAPSPPNTAPQLRISGNASAQYNSKVSHKMCVDLVEHQVKCLVECSFVTLLVTVC